MLHTHETLSSWLKVYHLKGCMVFECNTSEEIKTVRSVYPRVRPIGANHSYNRSALHKTAIRLGEGFNYVEPIGDGQYRVGGACTIETVMLRLLADGYMLPNSGNHRKQTFIGACIGGTHGFGKDATMFDMITDSKHVFDICYEVNIQAVPATAYVIKHCICPLSKLNTQSTVDRSYAIFPHSSERDPLAIVSEFTPHIETRAIAKVTKDISSSNKNTWWRIRAIQLIQKTFPGLHRRAQRLLTLAKLKTWYSITSKEDIDSRYHPWPEMDRGPIKGSRWLYWSQRPSFQYHNLAFAVKPHETASVIRRLISRFGDDLAGFIGVRELTTKSRYPDALNYDCPRNAIDVYVYPENFEVTEQIQKLLEESAYDIRFHRSKSI